MLAYLSTLFLAFTIECLFHKQQWSVLVWLGQQLHRLWSPAASEVQNTALRSVFGKTELAQQAIVDTALSALKEHQVTIAGLTTAWDRFVAANTGPKVRTTTNAGLRFSV